MDFKDLAGAAGELFGQNSDEKDSLIDQAAGMAKERFGQEGLIDGLAQQAKAYNFGGEGEAPAQPEAPAEPAPPAE